MSEENLTNGVENGQNENAAAAPDACWTFLSNHALVTMCLVDDPFMRMRDVAIRVGITERAVQRILTELEEGGFITRHRDGRRNRYTVHLNQSIGHPLTGNSSIFDLMKLHVRRNSAGEAGANRIRPILSQAANGTSFGRRRGPVARPASESPTDITPVSGKTSTNRIKSVPIAFEGDSSPNGEPTRTRGRSRKTVQTI